MNCFYAIIFDSDFFFFLSIYSCWVIFGIIIRCYSELPYWERLLKSNTSLYKDYFCYCFFTCFMYVVAIVAIKYSTVGTQCN